nr:cytochrome P450 704B1 [Tanacetum cinerariifolium]
MQLWATPTRTWSKLKNKSHAEQAGGLKCCNIFLEEHTTRYRTTGIIIRRINSTNKQIQVIIEVNSQYTAFTKKKLAESQDPKGILNEDILPDGTKAKAGDMVTYMIEPGKTCKTINHILEQVGALRNGGLGMLPSCF